MSDSFAELWNSSVPSQSQPSSQLQKPGFVASTAAHKRPPQDIFSILSSTGSSVPNSRPITPSSMGLSHQQKYPSQSSLKTSSGGDAFSGLLGTSLAGSMNDGARMTIAERAAKVERQRKEQLEKQHQVERMRASTWDGLDILGGSTSLLTTSRITTPAAHALDDNWGFGTAAPGSSHKPTVTSVQASSIVEDDWGLGDFIAPTVSQSNISSNIPSFSQSQALWDLVDVSTVPAASSSKQISSPKFPVRQRLNSSGDCDFGNREDTMMDDDSNNEDDVLGALSKPVDTIITLRPSPNLQSINTIPSPYPQFQSPSNTNDKLISKPVSPPPHILGQIVEMGFSVQQARISLASTDTGLDVQAALDALLSNSAALSPRSTIPQQHQPSSHPSRPPRGAACKDLTTCDKITPLPSHSQDREYKIQEQADKLLGQANEIGLSMFNKASSFWKEGKEKVQKAYEERIAFGGAMAPGGSSTSREGTGRPRWMQEAMRSSLDEWQDSDRGPLSDNVLPPQRQKLTQKPASTSQTEANPQTADLFSEEPVAYVSPFRRGNLRVQPSIVEPPSQPRPYAPSPVRVFPRQNVISAPVLSIAQSMKHKDLGAEKFQLGQYGAAESEYASAIACLPDFHLLLVPLYNNRAMTRLKTGNHVGVIEDTSKVIEIIGARYHPARETKVEKEEEGSRVDLGHGLVKALKRRAEAWEGREKWEEAGKDWEAVAAFNWVQENLRREAVRGAGRCLRMVQAASQPDAVTKLKNSKPPVPSQSQARQGPTIPSQALENLRSANSAAEAEDKQRYELKDSVDAKLLTWKSGKETNIRALIGSIDMVLWPELGLQKVGMADLVTPAQVKIRYTKVIAKLHPDKLKVHNTTVEQRMIANGVFGVLNEAWNAFKQ